MEGHAGSSPAEKLGLGRRPPGVRIPPRLVNHPDLTQPRPKGYGLRKLRAAGEAEEDVSRYDLGRAAT